MMKHLKNEKGIALVMVLVLSLIALAITSALIYLVIQGTKYSGFFKRYEMHARPAWGVLRFQPGSRGTDIGPGRIKMHCGDPDQTDNKVVNS
jgi:hypothetical protein